MSKFGQFMHRSSILLKQYSWSEFEGPALLICTLLTTQGDLQVVSEKVLVLDFGKKFVKIWVWLFLQMNQFLGGPNLYLSNPTGM